MSIKTYLEHRQLMRLIAVLLTILMLYSCLSLCMIDAQAAALEIGISLIALILSGFGIVASTTGAIDGMNQGLESLMGEFSESQGQDTGWFRGLFNTDNITSKGYNRLGVGGVLVAGIKLFVEWLRADKGLSESEPVTFYPPTGNFKTVNINGVNYPVITNLTVYRATSTIWFNENILTSSAPYILTGAGTITLPTGNSYEIKDKGSYLQVDKNGGYYTQVNKYNNVAIFGVAYLLYRNKLYESISYASTYSGGLEAYKYSASDDELIYTFSDNPTLEEPQSGWQIDEDNIDTDYLDNEDGSTKDVIFTPAFPEDMPLDDLDLGTIGGMEDAAGRTYEHTKTETGTATGTGEITTEVDLPSDGGGDQPDISIPEGGFFSTIWHYVVQALEDSAAGIAFIFQIVRTVIPTAILNLAWASCVLLITFGILNKFLK